MIDNINNKGLGWKPDAYDARDKDFVAKIKAPVKLPSIYLIKKLKMPPIVDQLDIGSCTGNAIASIIYFNLLNKHAALTAPAVQPSRLFIYYNERFMEGTVMEDAGAQIRDGIKSVANLGVCTETQWKYDVRKFTVQPPLECYVDALKFKALTYARVDGTVKSEIVNALLSGFPVVFGFKVFSSFYDDNVFRTGDASYPNLSEELLGGHCVYIVGYNADRDRFVCANSWGRGWGRNGYFSLPAKYVTDPNLSSDFWVINSIG